MVTTRRFLAVTALLAALCSFSDSSAREPATPTAGRANSAQNLNPLSDGGATLSARARPVPSSGDLWIGNHGGGSSPAKIGPVGESWCLYGCPGTTEGQFEDGSGIPDRQGWTGLDWTDLAVFWHRDTFNGENLNGHGPGNHVMWCGQTALQQRRWVTPPGYGNSWFDILEWNSPPLLDPAIAQTVDLDLYFNYDTEPGYDFFSVQYDSAGAWTQIYGVSGSNQSASATFDPPGMHLAELGASPIVFQGNDYASPEYGPPVDRLIRLRFVASSDGAWSDEDGLWSTIAGHSQVDDITVRYDDGSGNIVTSFEDFEGEGPYAWVPQREPFVGDFSKIFVRLKDLDPCVDEKSAVMTFLDDGTPPSNAPGVDGTMSTGGSTSPDWSYGTPSGWVVNYTGGLTHGQLNIANSVVSPAIAWDLPGPADDGIDVAGAILRFDVYEHLPLINSMFWIWSVRSSIDGGLSWGDWQDRNFVYWSNEPHWRSEELDVTDLLEPAVTHVQVSLGAFQVGFEIWLPNATPAPWFDNVSLIKYRLNGPVIGTKTANLANDGFPPSGEIRAFDQVARDQLDIPFDMARDVSTGDLMNIPGDSVVVNVVSQIVGTSVTDVRMRWRLAKNPLFEDAIRLAPNRAGIDENVDTSDPATWTGEVVGRPSTMASGAVVPNRWFFDLPDEDFLYPGDVLRYYVQASDDGGRQTTLPADVSGFTTGATWDRRFEVHGLPNIQSRFGAQPQMLVVDDVMEGDAHDEIQRSLDELGYVEAIDYDLYRVLAAGQEISNGIGSSGRHGATAPQLANYHTLLYFSGARSIAILSDGSNAGTSDKSDDVGVLSAWHQQPGTRFAVYFGDHLASTAASQSAAGATYVQDVLGVSVIDADVSDVLGGQSNPTTEFFYGGGDFSPPPLLYTAHDGCPEPRTFDEIVELSPPRRLFWLDPSGAEVASAAAGVFYDRFDGGAYRHVDVTIPVGFNAVWDPRQAPYPGNVRSRSTLLFIILDELGVNSSGPPTTTPPVPFALALSAKPNPFNPTTELRFVVAEPGPVQLRIYSLRGERVRTLLDAPLKAGPHVLRWNGRDDRGATVASGVYLAQLAAGHEQRIVKLSLLK